MPMGEPVAWTQARDQRLQSQYPQFQVGSPTDVLNVDAFNIAQGGAPSQFSQDVMRLANFAASQMKPSASTQPAQTSSSLPDSSAPPASPLLEPPSIRPVFRTMKG
jgi:hypothetical protein